MTEMCCECNQKEAWHRDFCPVFEIAKVEEGYVIRETDFCARFFLDVDEDAQTGLSWNEVQNAITSMLAYVAHNS